jgi:drug/metabolite transporter (DMT)-like permease
VATVEAHGRVGLLALLVAVTIWGGSFVVVKDGLDSLTSFQLLALRFLAATIVLLPLAVRRPAFRATIVRPDVWLLGATLFAGLALQTTGLATASPGHSALLTSLAVVFVPFLVWLGSDKRPAAVEWFAVTLCVAGLLLVYSGFRGELRIGDGLSLLCALTFAVYLLLLDRASRSLDLISAMAVQCVVCLLLALVALPLDRPASLWAGGGSALAVLYVGILATAVAFGLQLFAQRTLDPVQSAVVLSLEPAVAIIISIALGREELTFGLVAGACLLVAGAVVSQRPSSPNDRDQNPLSTPIANPGLD